MATVIDRVDRLEEALANFVTSVGIEFNKVYNSQRRTEAELREFKEEMRGAAGRGRHRAAPPSSVPAASSSPLGLKAAPPPRWA